jgi:hypothetical protein
VEIFIIRKPCFVDLGHLSDEENINNREQLLDK